MNTLFTGKAKAFRVAVIGGGQELGEALSLLESDDFRAIFPLTRIVAICPDSATPELLLKAGQARTAIYAAPREMLTHHPDVNILLDLNAATRSDPSLRDLLPAEATVLDDRATGLFWELLTLQQGCLTCQIDLTRTRAMMSGIMDMLEEDVLLLDADQRVVDVNRNVTQRLGRDKSELIGLLCAEVIEDGDRRCLGESHLPQECPFEATMRTGRKAEGLLTKVDPNGRMQYFRIYTYPIQSEHQDVTHVVEIRRDITARTYMEKRLQQSEKMAAIGELATYIAHEIRNPLFAIGGFANALLRSKSLDTPALDKVKIILEESKRLNNILRSILNFAKPMIDGTGEIDVNAVLRETMELMGMGCSKQGIELHQSYGEHLPKVRGDAEHLKQCLINIVKNAIEAMPGGGRLDISTDLRGGYIILTVRDTGSGIPEALREKIFSPFFTTKEKGSGLGLAMTKKIVEEFGGEVDLQSQEGVGTTMRLLLPPVLAVTGEDPRD